MVINGRPSPRLELGKHRLPIRCAIIKFNSIDLLLFSSSDVGCHCWASEKKESGNSSSAFWKAVWSSSQTLSIEFIVVPAVGVDPFLGGFFLPFFFLSFDSFIFFKRVSALFSIKQSFTKCPGHLQKKHVPFLFVFCAPSWPEALISSASSEILLIPPLRPPLTGRPICCTVRSMASLFWALVNAWT